MGPRKSDLLSVESTRKPLNLGPNMMNGENLGFRSAEWRHHKETINVQCSPLASALVCLLGLGDRPVTRRPRGGHQVT